MIVQCPSCNSRYRIKDANIPESGGKIRCPSCSHSFVVYPESDNFDGDKTSITSGEALKGLVNQMATPAAGSAAVPPEAFGSGPQQVWQQAQQAMAHRGNGALEEESEDLDDEWDSKTEIVDPSSMSFPFQTPTTGAPAAMSSAGAAPGGLSPEQEGGPTVQTPEMSPALINQFAAQEAQQQQQQQSAWGQPAHAQQPAHAPQQPGHVQQQPGRQVMPTEQSQELAASAASADVPSHASEPAWDQGGLAGGSTGLSSEALFDDINDEEIPNAVGAPMQSTGPAAPPSDGASVGDPSHEGPWKLQTTFGLVYEFPDTRGLRSWIQSREELDGVTVSADDGDTFHPLDAFPQLQRSSRSTSGVMTPMPAPPAGASTSGSIPAQFAQSNPLGGGVDTSIKGPKVNAEYRPPSRDAGSKPMLWVLFLVLATGGVIFGLEQSEIFKVSDVLRDMGVLSADAPEQPKVTPDAPKDDKPEVVDPLAQIDPEELQKKQAAELKRLLRDIERLVEGNKLPAALDKLETTEQIAPDNVRVFELKAEVHEKLGQKEEAEAATKRADELRAALEAPEGGGDGAEGEGEGEGEPESDSKDSK